MSSGTEPDNGEKNGEEHAGDSLENIPNGTIFTYTLDDSTTPGGIKVRFRIRVVTGPEAGRLDARQAHAIKELLQWAQRHQARR